MKEVIILKYWIFPIHRLIYITLSFYHYTFFTDFFNKTDFKFIDFLSFIKFFDSMNLLFLMVWKIVLFCFAFFFFTLKSWTSLVPITKSSQPFSVTRSLEPLSDPRFVSFVVSCNQCIKCGSTYHDFGFLILFS